jgi:ATP-dependent helicase HepA
VDHNLTNLSQDRSWALTAASLSTPARSWLGQFPEIKEQLLPELLAAGRRFSEQAAARVISRAKAAVEKVVGGEAARLERLKRINPAIREDEIRRAKDEATTLVIHIDQARLRLDSLRLIKVS